MRREHRIPLLVHATIVYQTEILYSQTLNHTRNAGLGRWLTSSVTMND